MKIAIILQQKFDPNAGGVQRVTNNLSQLLSVQNEVYIICFNKNEKNRYVDNIPIVAVKSDIELKNILDQLNIEVIINQTGYSVKFTKILLYITNNKAKIINNLHINPLNFYQNYNLFISNFLVRKNFSFFNNFLLRKLILGYHILKQNIELYYIIKKTDAFVMLSERFKAELFFLAPVLKKYKNKIYGIGNPFQRPRIDVSKIEKENIILFVGRLNILQKRVDLLLEIWKKLHEQAPNWQFWVCGDGEDQYYMEQFCQENKLNRVTFFGKVNPTEYYKKAKIFHMTSAFEGFGNVLIEAQSYGCVPVLFNSYSAAQDIINHNKDGILVTPFDINEYIEQTKKLIDDPEKLNKMKLNAYENVSRFSFNKTYLRWYSIFNDL